MPPAEGVNFKALPQGLMMLESVLKIHHLDIPQNIVARVSDAKKRLTANVYPTGLAMSPYFQLAEKIEIGELLAKEIYGSADHFARLDMNEYKGPDGVRKLIGHPACFGVRNQGGYLVDTLKRRPKMVFLMENIQEAHPDLLKKMAEILDKGFLKDGKNNLVNFTDTIFMF